MFSARVWPKLPPYCAARLAAWSNALISGTMFPLVVMMSVPVCPTQRVVNQRGDPWASSL
jgi:hypothetical protein